LVDISNDLKTSLKIYERNKELEAKVSSYQQQLDEASKARADRDATISRMKKDLEQSATELAKLKGLSRTFSLLERKGEKLIAGYTVGFKETYGTNVARLIFDNKEIEAGPWYTIKLDGDKKHCFLTVLNINRGPSMPSSVDFDFTCKSE
jgi:hypothetical protein